MKTTGRLLAAFALAVAIDMAGAKASADAYLAVDNATDQPQVFVLHGSAMGADLIHVWAWPPSGPVFLGEALPNQADAARNLASGGFSLQVRDLPVGSYPIAVWARDRLTGQFTTQVVRIYSIRACEWAMTEQRYTTASGVIALLAFSTCL